MVMGVPAIEWAGEGRLGKAPAGGKREEEAAAGGADVVKGGRGMLGPARSRTGTCRSCGSLRLRCRSRILARGLRSGHAARSCSSRDRSRYRRSSECRSCTEPSAAHGGLVAAPAQKYSSRLRIAFFGSGNESTIKTLVYRVIAEYQRIKSGISSND